MTQSNVTFQSIDTFSSSISSVVAVADIAKQGADLTAFALNCPGRVFICGLKIKIVVRNVVCDNDYWEMLEM